MKTKIKKDWFGRLKSIEEIHNDSKLWLSEIDFIKDEIRFLNHLLSSNYIDFLGAGMRKKIDSLTIKIGDEKRIGNSLYKQIKSHKNILSNLIKTKSVSSNTNYLETHKNFEREIFIYTKKLKKLKRTIFKIVENIMRKKEQKILL